MQPDLLPIQKQDISWGQALGYGLGDSVAGRALGRGLGPWQPLAHQRISPALEPHGTTGPVHRPTRVETEP